MIYTILSVVAVYTCSMSLSAHILVLDEVDGHALEPEATRPADAVYVQLAVGGEVIVDDQ